VALNLEGLVPATVLLMTADAEIDEPQLRRYICWVSDQGPVALPISDEQRALVRRALAEVGLAQMVAA
jgi:hypothetical protein